MNKIIYTKTDEAPGLATYSLLPIFKYFTKSSNIEIQLKDISLSSRIISLFNNSLKDNQKKNDDLKLLGDLTKYKDTNIIKLPNISASIPQLKDAIKELQEKGYDIPNYDESEKSKLKYSKVLGSAVNPVLREGNSDRRAPKSVKKFAKKNPHIMKDWNKLSKTDIYSMSNGDFYDNEKSKIFDNDDILKIVFTNNNNNKIVLKDNIKIDKHEIVDGTYMNINSLKSYYKKAIKIAKDDNILLSLHLKATMMKTSDPIIFGHCIKIYFEDLIKKYNEIFIKLKINFNNGLIDLYSKLNEMEPKIKDQILNDIEKIYSSKSEISMVDSVKNITNLHIPSDVIIDASIPAMIKNGGKMYDKNGELKDTLALIPDRTYANVFKEVIRDCKENGKFDVSTIGTVQNIGLMAKKAEEYGSHDKTFEIQEDGIIEILDEKNSIIFKFIVKKNDIFRMCQTKDESIQNWVNLVVNRVKKSNIPAIFWLDNNRPHDKNIIKQVKKYLSNYDTNNLDISILSLRESTKKTLNRMRKGLDTISVTGNVLRDYNTDLFPIIELGTSAKMLSIVPLLKGGYIFETGAGGSAPKHVKQLIEENHLRWDSLGEFMAIQVSLEQISNEYNDKKALILAKTLDKAILKLLDNKKIPSSQVNKLDNRGSHFYLSLYWSEELSIQNDNLKLKNEFSSLYKKLHLNEIQIIEELNQIKNNKIDLKGYYLLEEKIINNIMRPSKTFNTII
jgi:isocitrate dehydrogenase